LRSAARTPKRRLCFGIASRHFPLWKKAEKKYANFTPKYARGHEENDEHRRW
jgi:hypothetical protein